MFVVSLPHILGSCCCIHFAGFAQPVQPFVNWKVSHTQPLQIRLSTATTVSCAQLLGSHPCPTTLPSIKQRVDPTPSGFLYSRLQYSSEVFRYLRVFKSTLSPLAPDHYTRAHPQPRLISHRQLKELAWIMRATSA